ncbi:MAG: topoisomerase IV [Clostridia bacterium]|nr:topoisomerase IV [Clostridia bacterium]
MAKKRRGKSEEEIEIVHAPIQDQPITETLEKNYMPYVMSVIISRAIPEIDGLKPSHRKLLYTMYKMGLLTGPRTKSANIVGQTMKLNPHGDQAIYETMVRLTQGNETLLHPLVDSKGSFGKHYSTEMKYAASRYTEAKLAQICAEFFKDIDYNAVDMVDNYDGTLQEPTLLPTTFPNILVMPNTGIAVGMASNICSFNLGEVCDGTIALLRNPKTTTEQIMEIIKAPDLSGGGTVIYNRAGMERIYENGTGSFKIRARYRYDKSQNCIDIIEIPESTTIEPIMKKLDELAKAGKLREVSDFRDEIDLSGFKLTLDLKKGVDPDKLMLKLFKLTPLEDSFKCNFNILVGSVPMQLGVVGILNEWIRFRLECLKRKLIFELGKKKDRLHLLLGLGAILLDIDKAIRIIRRTEKEADVVPNLMTGFSIDKIQADYIAEIKLRNLNREYILNRIADIEGLQKEIAELEATIADELKQKAYIIKELQEVKKKYGKPRLSQIMAEEDIEVYREEEFIDDYKVRLAITKEGYFKKITFQSLRGNDEITANKDGDELLQVFDATNTAEILLFGSMCNLYRFKVSDFDCSKASALGDFMPAKLGMESGEKPIYMMLLDGFSEKKHMVFVFENGKGVRVPLSCYETKTPRKKLVKAFSDASPIVGAFFESDITEMMIVGSDKKAIVIKPSLLPEKTTRTSGGSTVISLKGGHKVVSVMKKPDDDVIGGVKGLNKIKLPATGAALPDAVTEKLGL